MSNPLTDLAAFLAANTSGYNALGAAKYVVLIYFYVIMIVGLALSFTNLRQDRSQRSATLLWLWITRVLIGCLWFQGMLSTLPFGTGNALHDGTRQMADRAAVPELARFVSDVILPHFALFDPLVFLAAFGFATAFILGLFVRIAGLGSLMAALMLWLGLYNQSPGGPAEWSWSYLLLAMLSGYVALFAAGRALGADAWIRRNVPSVRDRRPAGLPLRMLT